ncbi:hypothetical protein KIPB_016979, partial [Kipferlia bialata]|eukprot:g16979.t1
MTQDSLSALLDGKGDRREGSGGTKGKGAGKGGQKKGRKGKGASRVCKSGGKHTPRAPRYRWKEEYQHTYPLWVTRAEGSAYVVSARCLLCATYGQEYHNRPTPENPKDWTVDPHMFKS